MVRQHFADLVRCLFNVRIRHVQMCHRSKQMIADGIQQDPGFPERLQKFLRRTVASHDLEHDNIRLDAVGVHVHRRNLLQLQCETSGIVVVFLKPGDVVLQGIDARGSENTRLPHASTEHFSQAPEPGNPVLGRCDQ